MWCVSVLSNDALRALLLGKKRGTKDGVAHFPARAPHVRLVCGVQNGRSDRVARSPSRILLLLLLYDIGNGLISHPISILFLKEEEINQERGGEEERLGEGERGGGRGKEGEREKMYRCERKKLHSVYIFT